MKVSKSLFWNFKKKALNIILLLYHLLNHDNYDYYCNYYDYDYYYYCYDYYYLLPLLSSSLLTITMIIINYYDYNLNNSDTFLSYYESSKINSLLK